MSKAVCNTLPVKVRRARGDELEDCAELYERSGRDAFIWRPKDWFKAADFLRFAVHEEIYVAESHGAILGILSLYRPQSFVHCLYVEPSAQHFGIGRALLDAVSKIADGPLSLKVDAPNERALAFYERYGFTRADIGDDNGISWILMKMR